MDKVSDFSRMVIWLLAGLAFYFLADQIGAARPIPQIVCQKLGNVTMFSWVGYWISRMAIGRVYHHTPAGDKQARGLIIGASILAGALGL